MTEERDALLDHYRRMRWELLETIESLNDEQMSEPSLDGWSVKDHLLHLALWDDVRTSEVLRIGAGHDSAWQMIEGQDEAYNEMSHLLRRDLSVEQARWELAMSRDRLLDAIAEAPERALDTSLYGEAPLRSMHESEHAGWIRRWRDEKGY